MRLPEEQEDRRTGTPVIYTIVAVSALILLILGCVLFSNTTKPGKRNPGSAKAVETPEPSPETDTEFAEGEEDIEALYRENKLRSEDLDFWDMYKEEQAYVTPEPTKSPSPEPSREPTEEEMAADGKHVQVSYKDGTTQWIPIEEKLPSHEYDFTKMKATNGKMVYYQGNKKVSFLGVDLSKANGTVDFEALKEEGIDFVMLKIGERGYESGLVTMDENFLTNVEKAKEAGMAVGVYFCSQAVSVEEAVEEAKFVTDTLLNYRITYPVAFRMDEVLNDTARTDILDKEQKSSVAEAFLSSVEREGYSVILYGSKDWLLTELVPEMLLEYEVWLTEQSPIPAYPYDFKMWEYAAGETVLGAEKEVNYTICFVDYERR